MLTVSSPQNRQKRYTLSVPPSKYLANRLLVLSACAKGESFLQGIPNNEDMHAAISGLKALSAEIETEDMGNHRLAVRVRGFAGKPILQPKQLYTADNGTFSRLILPFALLCRDQVHVVGSQQMNVRPMGPLFSALEQLGGKFVAQGKHGMLPVVVSGKLLGGQCQVAGNMSSQYFSALLIAAPFAQNKVSIQAEGDRVSESYIAMTIDLMNRHGVEVEVRENTLGKMYSVEPYSGDSAYKAFDSTVEGDPSATTYFLAMAALGLGEIAVTNFPRHSLQGEANFIDVLVRMGCVESGRRNVEDTTTVLSPPAQRLQAIEVDMKDMPDAVPTLAVVAAAARGITTIRGIAHLRYKESNRIEGLTQQLNKAGVKAKSGKDFISIEGTQVKPAVLDSLGDHRLAMAFSLLSLQCDSMSIENEESVGKTFPHYFSVLKELGFLIETKKPKEEK